MENQLRNLEQRMEEQNQRLQAQLLDQNRVLEEQLGKLMQLFKGKNLESGEFGENSPETVQPNSNPNSRPFGYVPKLEFPSFDGDNSRLWIQKCEKYFTLCKIHEAQKVDFAAIHMCGKAEEWFHAYICARVSVSWSSFVIDVCARFKDKLGENVVEQFNKLSQTGSIEDYLDSFEHLKSLMIQRNPLLPDAFFLDSFIAGLKPTVRPFVKAFKPTSLSEAIEFARLQEESLEASKSYTKPAVSDPKSVVSNTQYKLPLLPTPQSRPSTTSSKSFMPQKTLTMAERAEKIAKGLCYFCDKPYEKGHNCSFRQSQLFTIFVPGEEDCCDDGFSAMEGKDETAFELPCVDPCISVNALAGTQAFQTMRVTGYVGKTPLHILVDSGSTHNFIDLSLAQKLGLRVDKIAPQAVTVADGNHVACQSICSDFKWRLQNTDFSCEALLIPLGSCDMVLGVQWLSTLGTVKWNFKKLWMSFEYHGVHHMLRGIPPKLDKSNVATLKVFSNAIHLFLLHTSMETQPEYSAVNEVTKDQGVIQKLSKNTADIFAEPSSLPPSRGVFDPGIPLLEVPIHRVFHVSQLKQFKGALPSVPSVPVWLRGRDVAASVEPQAVLDRRVINSQNQAKVQY